MKTTVSISIALSENEKTGTIKMTGQSEAIVCGCLGVERNAQGQIVTLYLDSLIHNTSKNVVYDNWKPSGAISTILKR